MYVEPIYIKVGGTGQYDPAVGVTDIVVPALKGVSYYPERIGYGTLSPTSYEKLASGGIRLLGSLVTEANGEYVFHRSALPAAYGPSSYTNGFNFQKVLSAMYGRIGWYGDSPRSGRFFEQFHAIVSKANLKAVLPEMADNQFLSTLQDVERGIILRALNGVFNEPELIDDLTLFDSDEEGEKAITNTGKFVGVRFKLPNDNRFAARVSSVSLLFDSDVTFNLYLFSGSIKAPLMVKEVAAQEWTQVSVSLDDLVLNFIGENHKGGWFYLGYFQDDLGTAKAIDEDHCGERRAKVFCWDFFETVHNGLEFDKNTTNGQYTYGLNLEVSSFYDHTRVITQNAHVFDEIIGLQMAAYVVEMAIHGARSNKDQRINEAAAGKLYNDLNMAGPTQDLPFTTGLKVQIDRELTKLKKRFFPRPTPQSVTVCS